MPLTSLMKSAYGDQVVCLTGMMRLKTWLGGRNAMIYEKERPGSCHDACILYGWAHF